MHLAFPTAPGAPQAQRVLRLSCRADAGHGRIFLPGFMASRQVTLEYLALRRSVRRVNSPSQSSSARTLGWERAPFAVLRLGDGLVLLPEQHRFERLCEQVSSALTGAGLTPESILATLPEARKRIFARHYKKPDSSKKTSRRRSRGPRQK